MQLTERGELVIGNLTERGELVIGALTATGRAVFPAASSEPAGGPDWSVWEDAWPGYKNTPRPPRRPTESWLPIVLPPIKDDTFELFVLGVLDWNDLLLMGADETAIESALIFAPASARAPAVKAVDKRDSIDRLLDAVDAEARAWAMDATAGEAAVKAVRRDAIDALLDSVDAEARAWAMEATR